MTMPTITLKGRRAKPFFAGHPWLFAGAIEKTSGAPLVGDVVRVVSEKGEFVAYGLYNPKSAITARLYSWHEETPITGELFKKRLTDAIGFRHGTLGLGAAEGGCRLVFGEGDGLSGLIVDRFRDVVALQWTSRALLRYEADIVAGIRDVLLPRAMYRVIDSHVADLEGMSPASEWVDGMAAPLPIEMVESEVTLHVDLTEGQKTGAYHDQRENRLAVARYAARRDVLDAFSYTGGFGLVALKSGGAASATLLDSSRPALLTAQKNAERNGLVVTTMAEDASAAMGRLGREGKTFGLVVCDPPKFAAKRADVGSALSGYQFLNRLAIGLVEPGGILATFSCSGHVSLEMFQTMLSEASQRAKREVRVLEVRGQPADHPVSLHCPESAYLKGIIARVM